MESSILALELYFEHRNYFPAIGVFLFPALLHSLFYTKYPQVEAPLLALILVYILVTASKTSSQVQVWSSGPVMRLNDVNSHPKSARANEAMAIQLASAGGLDGALAYSQKAFLLSGRERIGDWQLRDVGLHCLAGVSVTSYRLRHLGTADPERPFAVVSIMSGVVKLFQSGNCVTGDSYAFADRLTEIFLVPAGNISKASINFFILLGGFEAHLLRYSNAHAYTGLALAQNSVDVTALLMHLHFSSVLGRELDAKNALDLLIDLDVKGALSKGERKNLSLYH